MLKTHRSGFSLVEVMLLLLVLSLIVAASIPMITKRNVALPQRAIHGMYLCIAGTDEEGNPKYYTAVYDSKRATYTNPDASSCPEFIPPKTSGLFNIYLYGAGAGGYDYAEVSSDLSPNDEVTYTMGNSTIQNFRDGSEAITEGDIEQYLKGETVYLSVKLPGGKKGSNIIAPMHLDKDVACGIFDKEDTNFKHPIKVFDNVSLDYTTIQVGEHSLIAYRSWKTDLPEICTNYINNIIYHSREYVEYRNSKKYTFGSSTAIDDITFKGGEGGGVSYMNYSYNIPNRPAGKTWVQWLQDLEKAHKTELTGNFGSTGVDLEIPPYPKFSRTYSGGQSTQPDYTAIITTYYEQVVNPVSATNGDDALFWQGPFEFKKWNEVNDGKSVYEQTTNCSFTITSSANHGSCNIALSPLADLNGNTGKKLPYIKKIKNTYDHTHILGYAGESGKTRSFSAKNLPSPCTITASPGGNVVTSSEDKYELSDTTISCGENGSYTLSVKSGKPRFNTVSKTFSFNEIKGKESYSIADFPDLNEYSYVKQQDVDFNKLNAFYKFDLPQGLNVGFGGSGAIIVDSCIGLNGTISTYVSDANKGTTSIGDAACKRQTDETNGLWSKTPASSGGGGAVIIVW